MTTYPTQVLLRRPRRTPDEVAGLTPGDTVDHPLADHHDDRRQSRPQARVPDPLRVGDHTAGARLLATLPGPFGLALGEVDPRLTLIQSLVERPLDVLVEMRLVLLDGQCVLATTADDLGGDVFLTAHGIDGHHGPFEVQELEQLGNGRNLVGFGVGGHLAQSQVILHRPGR